MIQEQQTEVIRGLFDWRSAASRLTTLGSAASSGAENGDLALALELLSCNGRDRKQFVGTPDDVAAA